MEPSNRKSCSNSKLNTIINEDCETNKFLSANEDSDTDTDSNKPKINCDNRKLLLKKNLSWTTTPHQHATGGVDDGGGNLIIKQNLKASKSNPLVLEAAESITTRVKNLTNSKLKMFSSHHEQHDQHLQEQQKFHIQPQIKKLAPLAKAISTTSTLTAVTSTTANNLQTAATTPTAITIQFKQKNSFCYLIRTILNHFKSSGIGEPSVYHALVVIFLEFFSWGLLTMPVINVLNETFPDHTFLMNGLVMGIKGILSFLSAPLIGALSDVWGRKFFLLITVFFTCVPIPLMSINSWWFFAMISISGVFAVTFSVVFAYVADVTTIDERSRAYGLVSATFAASLVISPALGAYLNDKYSENLIVALATAIAVLDVFFILVAVPESLPEKVRPNTFGAPINWEQADPFAALRKVGLDQTILMQCVTVLLSYLPEAGQYSCIFVYLKLKMHFSSIDVSIFIAMVGILSIFAQVILGDLMKVLGAKRTIIVGLTFEMLQLLWYGVGSQTWMMWSAGVLAALGSITYPAISAYVSIHSTPDQQGVVQGMVTGMRGLCNGLGPAMFGVIFYLFNVDLNDENKNLNHNFNFDASKLHLGNNSDTVHVYNNQNSELLNSFSSNSNNFLTQMMPGPPFVFGALMVICAILVAVFMKEDTDVIIIRRPSTGLSLDPHYEVESGRKPSGLLSPLMQQDSAQL